MTSQAMALLPRSCFAVLPIHRTQTQVTAAPTKDQKRDIRRQQAIKRPEEPKDITGAILFPSSGDAVFLNAHASVVVGGQYRIG